MPNLARIDGKIQRGRGKEAKYFGQTFNVYRLGPRSAPYGIESPASLIATNVLAQFSRETSTADVEILPGGKTLLYTSTLDMRRFLPGDLFVEATTSYGYDSNAFTCCASRPAPLSPVFAATPINGSITRPKANPNAIDNGRAPVSAAIKEYEFKLGILQGLYAYPESYTDSLTSTSASIRIGMVMERLRDYPKSEDSIGNLYDDTRRQTWSIFVPLLPGESLLTRDIITGANGDRFEVTGVQMQSAGFFGQIVTTQRLRS